jgi:hypothetical protein
MPEKTFVVSHRSTIDFWTINAALAATTLAVVIVLATKKSLKAAITVGDVMIVLIAKLIGAITGMTAYFIWKGMKKKVDWIAVI